MKKIFLLLTFLIFAAGVIKVNAQTTYTWNGGTTSWSTPGNWTPVRTTPASNDILVVNTSSTIVLDFTSPETIGQLQITGGSSAVIFQTGAARVLNIGASVAGDDFTVSAGSSLTVQSTVNTIGLTIAMLTSNTASISGAINFGAGASTAQAHRLTTPDAVGISFETGSSFTTIGVSSGSPFGTTGSAATNNNLVFKSGSSFNFGGGANPFGAAAPASLVQFQSGSTYSHNSTAAPSFSGRSYANFILNATLSAASTGSWGKMDNLTIKAGVTFPIGSTNNRFSLTGNITVEPTGAFTTAGPLYPDLLLIGTGALQTVDFGTSNPSFRSISVGTDANVIFATNCGINAAAAASGANSNIYGNLNLADKVITGTAGTSTPAFINRSASVVTAQIATTALNANSNSIVTNNPTGISNGMLINFPGVFPANTYIISTSSGTFTTSKYSIAAAAIGTNFTITNNNATLSTSNTGGLLSALPGTYTYTFNGNLTFNAATTTPFPATGTLAPAGLTINAIVTLNRPTGITELLTVAAGSLDLAASDLTLRSTATNTARFAQTAIAAPFVYSGTGKIIVERYISNIGRKWRLLSARSTVTTQNIFDSWQESGAAVNNLGTWITAPGGGNGFDSISTSASILKHNQATPSWLGVAATNTGSITDEQGYMLFVRGDRNDRFGNASNAPTVLRTAGQLRVGAQAAVTVSATGTGRTLVGNPFASPINMETIFTGTANLDQNMYVWDPSLAGSNSVGGFRSVVRTGVNSYNQTPVVLGGTVTNDPTIQFIHSGQAVFLKATGTDASVVFTENMKAVTPTTVYNPIVATSGDQQIIANLMVFGNGVNNSLLADGIRVRFNDAYQAATTDDIEKMGNFGENISSYRNGKKLIVEQRPMITANDTIFLRITNAAAKDYRLQIGTIDFVQTNVTAYLQDTYKGTNTPIELDGNITNVDYSITSDAGSANQDRFRIVFAKAGSLPVSVTSVKAEQQGSNIAVEWKVTNQNNIARFEVEKSANGISFGKTATQTPVAVNGSDAAYNWVDVNATLGDNYYRIRTVGTDGLIKYSDIVKVTIAKGNPAITVYPNPVINKTISVQFNDMPKGVYQVRLINNMAQGVTTQQINHNGGSSKHTIGLDRSIASGTYRLEIVKPDNTIATRTVVITNQ